MKSLSLPLGSILRSRNNTYTIDKVLGQGSFGITYLGSKCMKLSGPLGTIETEVKVAIKEFFMSDINGRSSSQVTCSSQGGQYDYYRRKFKSEAENLSRLKHDNIINVYESFEANNTVYYVMEYVSGGSLNDYISKKRRLSEDETVGIALQICSALSYMHGRRILHLDLKPGNVMLHDDGRAVLIDFGLAKQFNSDGVPESSTTIGHGTPGYAPLEQSNYNEDKHHGFPSTMDVYALGGTMFKMLTGKCPPPSSDILNEGFPAYELQNSGAGEGMIGIISRAMSPMVSSRYHSADEMSRALRAQSGVPDIPSKEEVEATVVTPGNKVQEITAKPSAKEEPSEAVSLSNITSSKRKKYSIIGISSLLFLIILYILFLPRIIFSVDISGSHCGHDYVDLGLPSGLKWATCNVGASSPEEYGSYYAWGETSEKSEYTMENSVIYSKKIGDISGNSQYDAARYSWGGNWRLPTNSEIKELTDNCNYKWVIYNGVKGGLFTSKKNGSKLFLPAAGYRGGTSLYYAGESGGFRSSTPIEDDDYGACSLDFDADCNFWDNWGVRFDGQSVRPVSE